MKTAAPLQHQSSMGAVQQLQQSHKQSAAIEKRHRAVLVSRAKPIGSYRQCQRKIHLQRKENNTGLPETLKAGVEALSGYSMDSVRVHYNSSKPAVAGMLMPRAPTYTWHRGRKNTCRTKPGT